MYYGYNHTPHPDDKTVLECKCGWRSDLMTKAELGAFGIPWYCDDCGNRVTKFWTFGPDDMVPLLWRRQKRDRNAAK
jgi:hypothetical protein